MWLSNTVRNRSKHLDASDSLRNRAIPVAVCKDSLKANTRWATTDTQSCAIMNAATEAPTRVFRSEASRSAEIVTRGMLPAFLESRAFVVATDERKASGQTITASTPGGADLKMRVRLCWRRDGREESESTRRAGFSAAQILAHIKNDDWIGTLTAKVDRERSRGVTHFLLAQRDHNSFVFAALIPVDSLVPIWVAQRDASERLIRSGRLGRRKKNHAMNGSSPTIHLQDDRAPEVADELWTYPGVIDLVAMQAIGVALPQSFEAWLGGGDEAGAYAPTDDDNRPLIDAQIRARRGQQRFRDELRRTHGDRCLVTGCRALEVLEAAHISPYRGEQDHHVQNGLLLRADVHTLFDLDLLGFEPDSLRVSVHPELDEEYANLAGRALAVLPDVCLSPAALRLRFAQFQRRCALPR